MNDTDTKENIEIRPAAGRCQDCMSALHIERPATVKIDGRNLCDYHAELAMIAVCRRNTIIKQDRYERKATA